MKKSSEAFEKSLNHPWKVTVSEKNKKYFYLVKNGLLYDCNSNKIITVENVGKTNRLNADLTSASSKSYIYLECKLSEFPKYSISSAAIKESSSFLKLEEGGGFPYTLNTLRCLIAIIGQGGRVSQKPTKALVLKFDPSVSGINGINGGIFLRITTR